MPRGNTGNTFEQRPEDARHTGNNLPTFERPSWHLKQILSQMQGEGADRKAIANAMAQALVDDWQKLRKDEKYHHALAYWQEIVDRVEGKSKQSVAVDVPGIDAVLAGLNPESVEIRRREIEALLGNDFKISKTKSGKQRKRSD